jgi:two-component system response regulator FixJ
LSEPPVIAIVDDDEAVREALFDLLQVEGLAARTFDSATAFLAAAAATRFDCLVTDVRMPEIDGLELQRRLRARGSGVPVIFVTSLSDEAVRARALRDENSAWFTKPVADETLLRAVRAALAPRDVGRGTTGG